MDGRANDQSFESYRNYLHLLGRLELDPGFQGKLDLSGVVQQTLFEAERETETFRGSTELERATWLRRIFAHNLTDEVRKLSAQMRDVRRERSLEARLEDSSARVEAWLAAEQSSPSQHAARQEELVRLADALTRLPDDQRVAVELHHLRGWTLAAVAEHFGRSRGAAASLIFRGLEQLRQQLVTRAGKETNGTRDL